MDKQQLMWKTQQVIENTSERATKNASHPVHSQVADGKIFLHVSISSCHSLGVRSAEVTVDELLDVGASLDGWMQGSGEEGEGGGKGARGRERGEEREREGEREGEQRE